MHKISIVMATYNGEKYIKQQLQSLLEQTKKADEVLIYDDCSTDRTVMLINKFIKENKLQGWRIVVNSKNKGWKRNFFELLCQASGDLIFMCDQDDIWVKDKIESMSKVMIENSDILCLVGRDNPVDDKGKIYTTNKNESGKVSKVQYQNKFYSKIYRGCAMCISKEVITEYKKMKCDYVGHDAVCAHIALMKNGLYSIEKTVLYHRFHGGNATASKMGKNYGCGTLEGRIVTMQEDIKYFTKLKKQMFVPQEQQRDIQNYINCLKIRYNYLTTKDIIAYLKKTIYICRTIRVSQYIGDIAYAMGLNKEFGNIGNIIVKK